MDEDEDEEDALLEEASKGNLDSAPEDKLEVWDLEKENREMLVVADLLQSESSSVRQSRAEHLLAEVLRKGALQVPAVEHERAWEGPAKSGPGYCQRGQMASEGAHSSASDWDRNYEPINSGVVNETGHPQGPDEKLAAEGVLLLHSRSSDTVSSPAFKVPVASKEPDYRPR
jgi:hypothetical protein